MNDFVTRTVYGFGSPCEALYGKMVLEPDGNIFGYTSTRERRWAISSENRLQLFDEYGACSSSYILALPGKVWMGYSYDSKRSCNMKWPLALLPVIELEDRHRHPESLVPTILVNSIPKSGTYFLEKALTAAGCDSRRLHVAGDDIIDDYRGIPDWEIHRSPILSRIKCRIPLLTKILGDGHLVGHIETYHTIAEVKQQGHLVITLRRNLRDVLTSFYRFSLTKVDSTSDLDTAWKVLTEPSRFLAFCYFYEAFLRGIARVANTIANDDTSLALRYEDLVAGELPPQVECMLDSSCQGFAHKLKVALAANLNTQTPTWSGARSNWRDNWSADVSRIFSSTGLADANAKLGYE